MLRKTSTNLDKFIHSRRDNRVLAPQCATCLCDVDSEEIVDGDPGFENEAGQVLQQAGTETCKVLVKHHGAEELHVFDMGSRNWGYQELAKWMGRRKWFNPFEQTADS